MDRESIKLWSDIVWHALCEKGGLSIEELAQATSLGRERIYAAIGWLARDGNVCFVSVGGEPVLSAYNERYY